MYARVTSYQVDPTRIEEMSSMLAELKGQIMSLPGIKSCNTVWREDGHGVSMSIYDCRASAEEAAPVLEAIWAHFSTILVKKPSTVVYDRTQNMLV